MVALKCQCLCTSYNTKQSINTDCVNQTVSVSTYLEGDRRRLYAQTRELQVLAERDRFLCHPKF